MAVIVSLAVGIAGGTGAYAVIREASAFRNLLTQDQWAWVMLENRELGLKTPPRLADYDASRQSLRSSDRLAVTPGFFRILGQEMLAGRGFDGENLQPGADAIVVYEATARVSGGTPREAVGNMTQFDGEKRRVVGVVEDTRNPAAPEPFGTQKVYWPLDSYDSATTFLLTGKSHRKGLCAKS